MKTRVMTPMGLGVITKVYCTLDPIEPLGHVQVEFWPHQIAEAISEGQEHRNDEDIRVLVEQILSNRSRSYVDAAQVFAQFIKDRRLLSEVAEPIQPCCSYNNAPSGDCQFGTRQCGTHKERGMPPPSPCSMTEAMRRIEQGLPAHANCRMCDMASRKKL